MNNIVFFGQADAGKSTLAGYLVARYGKDFSLSRFISKMKREYPDYITRLAFSSIMNTNRDEIKLLHKLNTRDLHLRKIVIPALGNVTIIDTPGSELFRKQRERGMFYGSIGIFFMEINNILDHKYSIETLAPIALWSRLENKHIIFLLTKFDMADYKEELYNIALDKVHDICNFFGFEGNVTVIPTAVDVDRIETLSDYQLDTEDLGENILSHSKKMPWYKGSTVIEAVKAEMHELDRRDEEEPLIFCITDQIDRPNSYNGKVWNIKILSGILRLGQEICLAPVKTIDGEYKVLTANIRELRNDLSRYDEQEKIEIARKGEMYGMDIRNCSIEKRHARKEEYDALSSTCGFSSSSEYVMSDLFSFKIDPNDRDGFKEEREMKLIWFGRSLYFYVDSIEEDNLIVHGRLKTTQIALPLFAKTFSQSILIKGYGEMEFYSCKLLSIG